MEKHYKYKNIFSDVLREKRNSTSFTIFMCVCARARVRFSASMLKCMTFHCFYTYICALWVHTTHTTCMYSTYASVKNSQPQSDGINFRYILLYKSPWTHNPGPHTHTHTRHYIFAFLRLAFAFPFLFSATIRLNTITLHYQPYVCSTYVICRGDR